MIDEHVNRIENSGTMNHSAQDESPTMSLRSTPGGGTAPSVRYWQKWVSPDELPCRDVRPATPTRRPPRRPRGRVTLIPGSRTPCVKKRKSPAVDTEQCKKRRTEPCRGNRSPTVARKCYPTETRRDERPSFKRQRSFETDCKQAPRPVSPCYQLPTRKPSRSTVYKPSKAKLKKSPAPSPVKVGTVLLCKPCPSTEAKMSKLTESTRISPNDFRAKPCSEKKPPCRNVNTAGSTQADLHTASPDAVMKFVPCNQQRTEEGRPYERIIPCLSRDRIDSVVVKPCRELDVPKTRPPPHTTREAHSICAEKELSPKEKPCAQRTHVITPCKDSMDVGKQPPEMAESRDPSEEKRCKNRPETDDLRNTQFSGSKDEKVVGHSPEIHSVQNREQAEKYKKCKQITAVSDSEKLSKSDAVPLKISDKHRREKPCDKTRTKLVPIIPHTQNMADETRQSRRRCRRRVKRNEDKASQKDSAVTSNLTREQTIPAKQRECTQKSVLADVEMPTELKTPAERLKTSETKIIEKPCKNTELPMAVVQESKTETKNDFMSEAIKAKLPEDKCPCSNNVDMHSDNVMAQEQLKEKIKTKKTVVKECSKIDEPEVIKVKKPCKKKTEKYNLPMQIPETNSTDKQKPCQPKTEARVPVPIGQSKESKKPCKKQESFTQKRCTEKTAIELESFTDKEENQLDIKQDHNEDEELLDPCLSSMIDPCTAPLPCGQYETTRTKQTPKEPCLSANESLVQKADQRVAMPTYGGKCRQSSDLLGTGEAEEDEPSYESYSPRNDTNRRVCPDTEKSQAPQTMKPDRPMPIATQTKPCQETVTKSTNEQLNDDSMVDSIIPVLNELVKPAKKKCQQQSTSQTVDDNKDNQVHSETRDQQLTDNITPCQKSRFPTSDKSVESTTKLIRRCRQERILKLFKYKKKLPCQSGLLAPESSTSTVPSYQPSIDDQLSDYESAMSSQQLHWHSGSHQNMSSTVVKDPVLSINTDSQNQLLMYDADPSNKAEILAERIESVNITTSTYDAEEAKAVETAQSAMTNHDGTGIRKIQSDDHEVITRRQNLSNEAIMHTSEPSIDVPDSWTPAVATEKTPRKDSGLQRVGKIAKPLRVPRALSEDITTLLELESSDNASSEVVLQSNILRKQYDSPKQRSISVTDGSSSSAEEMHSKGSHSTAKKWMRRDSGVMPTAVAEDITAPPDWDSSDNASSEVAPQRNVRKNSRFSPKHRSHALKDGSSSSDAEKHRKGSRKTKASTAHARRIPHRPKVDEDPNALDSWSSTEESANDTPPNVTIHSADQKRHQDTDNKDNSNSCVGKASYKLDDSDWSDSDQDAVQSQPNTQYSCL